VLARLLTPAMVERGSGHVVLMSSLAGKVPAAGMTVYNATKFGLRGFGHSLRAEVAGRGVGVSLVSPTFVSETATVLRAPETSTIPSRSSSGPPGMPPTWTTRSPRWSAPSHRRRASSRLPTPRTRATIHPRAPRSDATQVPELCTDCPQLWITCGWPFGPQGASIQDCGHESAPLPRPPCPLPCWLTLYRATFLSGSGLRQAASLSGVLPVACSSGWISSARWSSTMCRHRWPRCSSGWTGSAARPSW